MSVEDDTTVLDADEVLDPAAVPLTDREPVIDRLKPAQRELLFRKHAMIAGTYPDGRAGWRGPNGLDETDIAGMLEVAWLLGLDPFTPGEIWCARSKAKDEGKDAGKLLVMVGRDGRRKIVQRNGLRMRGDVVRANDEFAVEHTEPRKTIRHTYSGFGKDARGDVVGAWSEVWDPRSGETRGFFAADIAEYKPKTPSDYSPWSHQTSAMILAAAERQSTAMGTPLSGLIGEGEAEINREPDRPVLGGDAAPEGRQLASGTVLPGAVWMVMARAATLRHRGLMDQAAWEMRTAGQSPEEVARQVQEAHDELDRMEADSVPDPHGGKAPVDGSLVDVTIQKAPLTEPPAPSESEPERGADLTDARVVPGATVRFSDSVSDVPVARSLDDMARREHEQAGLDDAVEAARAGLRDARAGGDDGDVERAREDLAAVEREQAAAADPAQDSLLP